MNPHDLVDAALILASQDPGKPRQVNLKRAFSTAYYAMFHALSRSCVDSLVGTAGARRSRRAWQQAHRSVKHSYAKNHAKGMKYLNFLKVSRNLPASLLNFRQNGTRLIIILYTG